MHHRWSPVQLSIGVLTIRGAGEKFLRFCGKITLLALNSVKCNCQLRQKNMFGGGAVIFFFIPDIPERLGEKIWDSGRSGTNCLSCLGLLS